MKSQNIHVTRSLYKLYHRCKMAGVDGSRSAWEEYHVTIINSLSFIMGFLVLALGLVFSYAKPVVWVVVPVLVEVLGFFAVIALNWRKLYFAANLTMYVLHMVAAIYWSALMGEAIPLEILVVFLVILLICGPFFLYKDKRVRLICVTVTILLLLVLQINYVFKIYPPVTFNISTTYFLRLFTTIGILLFILMVISEYVKENERINRAKSVFIRESYHELRTPLNAVFGIAQILQSRVHQFPVEDREDINNLYIATYNARNIIDNVLDHSKIEAGRFTEINRETFNLHKCLEHCIAINNYIANFRNVNIKLIHSPQLPLFINSDPIILLKIINNIVSNAAKFALADTIVEVHVQEENEKLCFTVENQGMISQEKAQRIFEPFNSERNNFSEGTGLGLPITRHLITLLGGQITLNVDETRQTTTFSFFIPLDNACRPPVNAVTAPGGQQEEMSVLKMLIIDDDYINRSIMRRFVTRMNGIPAVCDNVDSAITSILEDRPDVIISDLHMGEKGGIELLLQLQQMEGYQHIPVIIISGDAFSETRDKVLQAGAAAFICKPFLFRDVHDAVNNCMAIKEEAGR